MVTTPTVVVIGGGVLGLATALELVDRGVTDVSVIDRAPPGEGSSGRSVGMVETQYFRPDDIEARVYGRRYYDRMVAEHGLHFVASGYLRLGSTETDIATFERSVQVQKGFGVNDAHVLRSDEIARTRSAQSWYSMFSRASDSASSLMSARSTCHSGLCTAIAMPMQPEPVHRSSACDTARSSSHGEKPAWISSAIGERGTSARVSDLNLSPANHAVPVR